MKTRQEMIYEFMMALVTNPAVFNPHDQDLDEDMVWGCACELADKYLGMFA